MSAAIEFSDGRIMVSGALTAENVTSLLAAAPTFSGEPVEISIAETSEIDSAGLALLVYWEGVITALGGTLKISGISPRATSLMRISGLAHMTANGAAT